jgi:GNAT superfamily N-acetyltransferase
VSDDGTYGWIDQIYLEPAATGFGIGGILIARAKEILRSPIRLYTFQQNEAARRFYRRHGFKEIALSDGSANEEKTPDVLMEWRR